MQVDEKDDPAALAKLNMEILHTALGDQPGVAKGVFALMDWNAKRQEAYVADLVKRGEVAREDANTVFLALNMAQTQKIATFIQGLASAQYISKERKELVDRLLPPGTRYTFGPGTPLYETMVRAGMNPQPIEAVEVPRSYLVPRQA